MPRYRFYNRRFASRAPEINTTFGDFLPCAVGKPAGARLSGTQLGRDVSVILPRRALNHLAVIQPPTASCLDGTLPALGRLATTFGAGALFVGGSATAFSADGGSASSSPLAPLAATGRNAKRPDAYRLSPFRPAHANATDLREPRGAFHRARPARALFRGSWGAPPSLAGEFGAARVHRCSKTSTRPLAARCSRAPSRPRALVRLLQVNALTSTTEDRSNIPNHRNPWLGRLPCSFRKFPSEPRATADASQGQGSRTPSLDIPHYDCS